MGDRTLQSLFSPATIGALRTHPRFHLALDELAEASLLELSRSDENGRWMFRDIGGSSLYLAAIILHCLDGGLTAANLATAARVNRTASRGRVMAFIRRGQEAKEIIVPPGSGPWTRRRLILSKTFIERFRTGNRAYAEAATTLDPSLANLADRLNDDRFFQLYVLSVAQASLASGAGSTASMGSERIFLERDRGGSMLFRMMLSQPRPRARLLGEVSLSRSRLSREFDVSRVHINRLLADAEAQGLVSLPAPDRLVFSQTLSDDVEEMMARTLQITRAALLGAKAMWEVSQKSPQSSATRESLVAVL